MTDRQDQEIMSLLFEARPRNARAQEILRWARPLSIVALLIWVATNAPTLGLAGHGRWVLAAFVTTALAWAALFVVETWLDSSRTSRPRAAALVAAGAAGAWLAAVDGQGPAVALPFVATAVASSVVTVPAAATVAAAVAVVWAAGGREPAELAWLVPILALMCLLGAVRQSVTVRAEQAELLLAQAERARSAQAETAALAERARIARDLHDVLAHSMAALAVQLEAADALLADGQVERAHDTVVRARQLARDGLVETRRAVAALREDHRPLAEELQTMADRHGDPVRLELHGSDRPLRPAAREALYRAAQEALTNAGKHAPGAPVAMRLDIDAESAVLVVHSGRPPGAAPLTDTGAGLGLTGMAERASAAGGAAQAGPVEDGWTVRVAVPA